MRAEDNVAPRAGRAQPRLPRPRRDRRHGDLRPRADPAAGARDGRRARRARQPRGGRRARRAVGRGVPMQVVPVHARNRVEWVRGEQQHVPRMARGGCDLIHSLASHGAAVEPRARAITTIHDLNYKLVPEAHFGLRALGMRVLVPASRAALAPDHRRRRVDARATSPTHLGTPRGEGRRRAARRRRPRRRSRRRPRPSCATRLGARRRPGPADACRPSARTRT